MEKKEKHTNVLRKFEEIWSLKVVAFKKNRSMSVCISATINKSNHCCQRASNQTWKTQSVGGSLRQNERVFKTKFSSWKLITVKVFRVSNTETQLISKQLLTLDFHFRMIICTWKFSGIFFGFKQNKSELLPLNWLILPVPDL